jgi:hypothetical protein
MTPVIETAGTASDLVSDGVAFPFENDSRGAADFAGDELLATEICDTTADDCRPTLEDAKIDSLAIALEGDRDLTEDAAMTKEDTVEDDPILD